MLSPSSKEDISSHFFFLSKHGGADPGYRARRRVCARRFQERRENASVFPPFLEDALQKCGRFYIMSPYRVSGTELRPGNMEE